jgi:multidrug efflux pump subunit AcrA (membrane-fusion protein)
MLVEAELPNPDGKLLPGMFGQALIKSSQSVASNRLPSRAVRFKEDGEAYVYVVAQDGTVKITPVTTGADDGVTVEIVEGLSSDQRVVDAHLERFAEGQRVLELPK